MAEVNFAAERPDDAESSTELDVARREFLQKFSKVTVVIPPAAMLLISTSLDSPAIGASSGHKGKGKGK